MTRSKEAQDALDEFEFAQGPMLELQWDIGFNDRGHGHGDYAVICLWEKRLAPFVVVKCPCRAVAEHIVTTHNASLGIKEINLFAWIGEDEGGSGEVGIKQAFVPAGYIPLVTKDEEKLNRDQVIDQLQNQANKYRKTIRYCRFVFAQEIIRLEPEENA